MEENMKPVTSVTKAVISNSLRGLSVKKVFKGVVEAEEKTLERVQESFESRGYIKLRAQERILFNTGVTLELPEGKKASIKAIDQLSIERGIICVETNITSGEEITVLLYNSTPYLNQVSKNEIIAEFILGKIIIEDVITTFSGEFYDENKGFMPEDS